MKAPLEFAGPDMETEAIGCPPVREPDGLAMSSHNRFLSPGERARALLLPRTLMMAAADIGNGSAPAEVTQRGAAELVQAGYTLDYLEVRHAEALLPLTGAADEPNRILAPAGLGATRLIDTVAV